MKTKKLIIRNIFNTKKLVLFMFAVTMLFLALIVVSVNALTDTTPPIILSVSPDNLAQDLPKGQLVTVVFSEDMDPSTINVNTFTVMQRTTPEFGGFRSVPIVGVVSYFNRVAVFNADESLSPNQVYGNVFTVMITTGVKDLQGNAFSQDYVWSFTTGEDPFNTGSTTSQTDQSATRPSINTQDSDVKTQDSDVVVNNYLETPHPIILSVSPANLEQDLSGNALVTVVFSEDMDPSTINVDTFTVMQRTTPEFGGYRYIPLVGTVTYLNRIAVFNNDRPFSPNQVYGNVFTVVIKRGVKTLDGAMLSKDYVWSFTTGVDPYNTGATTSQTNQNVTNVTAGLTTAPIGAVEAQPPLTNTPLIGTQATTTSISPWLWIAGLALLLLFVVLIFIFAINPYSKSVSRKDTHTEYETSFNPISEVHPVTAIEGIGPEYSKALRAMGIKNTAQLWRADAARIAIETGAPLSSVKSWQNMAELSSIKDIGPQYAELLERSGVHSVEQLKNYDSDALLRLVRKKQDSLKINIQGNSPGPATVEHWIAEANNHEFDKSEGETA